MTKKHLSSEVHSHINGYLFFVVFHVVNNSLKTTDGAEHLNVIYISTIALSMMTKKVLEFVEYKICKELLNIYLLFIRCLCNKKCTHDFGCAN